MTMDMLEDRSGERDYALERLIMLSDGVFAIAITLLALELRPPEDWDHSLTGLWSGMWRPALAFVVSFLVIAAYWISHRRMFGRFRSADLPLTILNLLQLGLITLVPVATNLVYEGGPRSGGFVVYLALFTLLGLLNAFLWGYPALLKPALFRELPSKPARASAFVVMLILPFFTPLFGLVALGYAPTWLLIPALALVLVIRVIRGRAQRALARGPSL